MSNDGTHRTAGDALRGSADGTRLNSSCATGHHRAEGWPYPRYEAHRFLGETQKKTPDTRITAVSSVVIALRPVVAHLTTASLLKDELLHADLMRSERGAITLGCRWLLPGRCFCFGLYHQTSGLLGAIQQSLATRTHIFPVKISALYKPRQRIEHLFMLFKPSGEFKVPPHGGGAKVGRLGRNRTTQKDKSVLLTCKYLLRRIGRKGRRGRERGSNVLGRG